MFNFKKSVVLITGSTRGIGWATAKYFAKNGATVLLNSANKKKDLNDCVKYLRKEYDSKSNGYFFDVSDYNSVKKNYKKIFEDYKRLDVLVNNAGIFNSSLIGMMEKEKLQKNINVNLIGSVYNLEFASRIMRRNNFGNIINVSSIVGLKGKVGQISYSTSKAGLIGLTKSAAKELSSYNIRVNAVAPGMINTEMANFGMDKNKIKQRVKEIGLGRYGEPEEVAAVICFLASPLSSYVTGQTIAIDGSWNF